MRFLRVSKGDSLLIMLHNAESPLLQETTHWKTNLSDNFPNLPHKLINNPGRSFIVVPDLDVSGPAFPFEPLEDINDMFLPHEFVIG